MRRRQPGQRRRVRERLHRHAAAAICGNAVKETGEACDDGNQLDGDGCENDCTLTPTAATASRKTESSATTATNERRRLRERLHPDSRRHLRQRRAGGQRGLRRRQHHRRRRLRARLLAAVRCGNGILDMGEQCDDGNTVDGDGCEADCTATRRCGNGIKDTGEACDDGNQTPGDGCENDCTATPTAAAATGCSKRARPATTATRGRATAARPTAPSPPTGAPSAARARASAALDGHLHRHHRRHAHADHRRDPDADRRAYVGGQVLVDATGTITCVGCDCDSVYDGGTRHPARLPQGVVSPGPHQHPRPHQLPVEPLRRGGGGKDPTERYEHRHDWRVGGATARRPHRDQHRRQRHQRADPLGRAAAGDERHHLHRRRHLLANGDQGMLRNLDSSPTGPGGPRAGQQRGELRHLPARRHLGRRADQRLRLPEHRRALGDSRRRRLPAARLRGHRRLGAQRVPLHRGAPVGRAEPAGPRTPPSCTASSLKPADVAVVAPARRRWCGARAPTSRSTATPPRCRCTGRWASSVALGHRLAHLGLDEPAARAEVRADCSTPATSTAPTPTRTCGASSPPTAPTPPARATSSAASKPGKLADLAIYRQQGTMTHRSVIGGRAGRRGAHAARRQGALRRPAGGERLRHRGPLRVGSTCAAPTRALREGRVHHRRLGHRARARPWRG